MDWVAYKQQTLISHSSEAGKPKIMALADSLSGGDPLPGSEMAIFWLCPYFLSYPYLIFFRAFPDIFLLIACILFIRIQAQ